MSRCSHLTCYRGIDSESDASMFMEYMENAPEPNWQVVCEQHVREENPHIELTEEIKELPAETLTHIKDELAE